jgi:hypothetical protein
MGEVKIENQEPETDKIEGQKDRNRIIKWFGSPSADARIFPLDLLEELP